MSPRCRALACLVLIAGLATTARAETAAPAFDLSQLMAHFAGIKSASAQFTERRYLHVLNAPLDDSGVLVYEAPDKLQKQTLLPHPENMVVEGDTLTIDADGKTQTLSLASYPQLGAFIEGIRATLAGDLGALQRIYDTHLDGNLDAWVLHLTPRDAAMQAIVSSIAISGSGPHIGHIATTQHDGDHTEMTIVDSKP